MYFKSIKKINLEPYGLFVGKFEQRSSLKMSRRDIFFTLGFDSQSVRPKNKGHPLVSLFYGADDGNRTHTISLEG